MNIRKRTEAVAAKDPEVGAKTQGSEEINNN
jgi:hypothetical protein